MPKEIVRGDGYDVEVRWGADGSVQVASVMQPPLTAESPASLGTLVETWSTEERFAATGLYSTLDRRQVNDLIRILRRARDAAYGRDE